MIGVAVSILCFYVMPKGSSLWMLVIPFTLLGFFIYGPQALLGVCAAQHATNKASATANGILGIFGYASTIVSGFGFGYIADHYGWNIVYVTIMVMACLAILSLLTMWGAKATGYEESDLNHGEPAEAE
jgi:OPA family glycerol-3-phosphate transporter-like MFS transporter/OPA family sugar phosphate sensor protein UhpC-like MFS transporter